MEFAVHDAAVFIGHAEAFDGAEGFLIEGESVVGSAEVEGRGVGAVAVGNYGSGRGV